MSRTMRGLVKSKAGPGIWMDQVPLPEPGTNEVLIRVEKTAICGTDLHIYTLASGRGVRSYPAS